MKFSCRENLEVRVYKHPHYQSLNETLMEDFNKLNFTKYENNAVHTNIKGSQFNFMSHPDIPKPKGIILIEQWVRQLINLKYCDIDFGTWIAKLDKGQETIDHDHYPFSTMVCVYFVNTPKGSSPLVFTKSGKKVKAEAGTLVIHPSTLRHKVPPNKCDNRVTIASNIWITEQFRILK